jgi:hypothetical protein
MTERADTGKVRRLVHSMIDFLLTRPDGENLVEPKCEF